MESILSLKRVRCERIISPSSVVTKMLSTVAEVVGTQDLFEQTHQPRLVSLVRRVIHNSY